MASIFEIIMLVCFGISWPFSIYKSWKSKSNKGKSLVFLAIIFIGYIAGIINKILYSQDYVLALYVVNDLLVFADISIWFRNRKFERKMIK